ncbi:MAG: hypothetical protein HGB17_17785 [Syntrophobacteraceae bacterium]|nr:hypothetical protein [Syntrophobacteraceae bacterium]
MITNRLLHKPLKTIRKVVIFLVGGTVLLMGLIMIVTPGPAFIVIPMGLGILAVEFAWARSLLKKAKVMFLKVTNDRRSKCAPPSRRRTAGCRTRRTTRHPSRRVCSSSAWSRCSPTPRGRSTWAWSGSRITPMWPTTTPCGPRRWKTAWRASTARRSRGGRRPGSVRGPRGPRGVLRQGLPQRPHLPRRHPLLAYRLQIVTASARSPYQVDPYSCTACQD